MKLNKLKKGDSVYKLMERHNPQLGVYYVFTKCIVERVTGKSISVDGSSYDIETGNEKKNKESAYGSVYYSVMTVEAAKIKFDTLIAEGKSARGFNN